MTWYPPGLARERVLVYGQPGSWKTAGAFKIAEKVAPHTLYVIDTDNAWAILSERVFADVDNIDVANCSANDWVETKRAVQRAFKLAGPDDWVVLDSVSGLWDQVTAWCTKLVHGDDIPAFLLEWRMKLSDAEAKKQNTSGAMMDLYNYINPEWFEVVASPVKSATCHVYMCAEANDTGNPHEDRGTKQMYGDFGQKPRTQKGMGFNAATVLLLDRDRRGATYSTVKWWGGSDEARNEHYEDLSTVLFKGNGWRPRAGVRP